MDASTIGIGIGMGVAFGSIGIGGASLMIYDAKRKYEQAIKIRMAELSALEKLLDTYGEQMKPDEFKEYAASFGLADISNEK